MADQEDLRAALLNLEAARRREAVLLRQSNALLAGLSSTVHAATPAAGLDNLLRSIRTSLDCSAVLLASGDATGVTVFAAADPTQAGVSLPVQLLRGRLARRITDLAATGWWAMAAGHFPGAASALALPVDMQNGPQMALVCLAEGRARFTPEDQDLLHRLAEIAAQAVASMALADRNALLAAVIDGASASVSIADATKPDAPLIYINDAFETLTGYPPSAALGRNCRFLSAEALDSPERSRLRQAVATASRGEFELLNARKDGRQFWNRLSLYPVNDEAGKARYLVATQVDITAQKEAQAQAEEGRRQFYSALSATSEGFLVLDPEGCVVFANAPYRDFFEEGETNWRRGEAFTAIWRDHLIAEGMAPDEASQTAETRLAAMMAGADEREEVLMDGRIVLINERRTEDGGAVSIATDVTSIKATERILAQRAAAFDISKDGIAVADEEGRLLYANRAYLALYGYDHDYELLGKSWRELYVGENAELIRRVGVPSLQATGSWQTEIVAQARNGEPVHEEISVTHFEGVGVICVARDIRARLRNVEERARMRDQLNASQRQEAIGQLAAGVAHDFNNLLSAIAGSTDLIRTDLPATHPAQRHIERIVAASDQAVGLVRRLLDFGAKRPQPEAVDLRIGVEDAASLLRAGVSKRITVETDLPDDEIIAEADPTDLLQIMLNLGINARDAIGQNAGEIRITLARSVDVPPPARVQVGVHDPNRRYAVITVSDNGHGIAPDQIESVFKPYVSTKGDAGTGLGLSVVSSTLSAVGGALEVTSELGVGTTFRIFWPKRPRATAPSADPPVAPVAPARARPDRELAGALILICDDIESVGETLSDLLEKAGAETAVCQDPRDALEALEADPGAWSALVTDFDMEPMNGGDLTRAARARRSDLPVILCSAFASQHEGNPLYDAVVAKPVSSDRLIDAVGKAIIAHRR